MNTRVIAKENRLSHWREVMRERSASGLSIRKFCRRAGFHENLYYYWQKKLRKATSGISTKEKYTVVAKNTDSIPNGWASIGAVSDDACKPNATALTIEVNGCQISVNAETDIDLITKVCRALVAL